MAKKRLLEDLEASLDHLYIHNGTKIGRHKVSENTYGITNSSLSFLVAVCYT